MRFRKEHCEHEYGSIACLLGTHISLMHRHVRKQPRSMSTSTKRQYALSHAMPERQRPVRPVSRAVLLQNPTHASQSFPNRDRIFT
jgi:hypothetical protein